MISLTQDQAKLWARALRHGIMKGYSNQQEAASPEVIETLRNVPEDVRVRCLELLDDLATTGAFSEMGNELGNIITLFSNPPEQGFLAVANMWMHDNELDAPDIPLKACVVVVAS